MYDEYVKFNDHLKTIVFNDINEKLKDELDKLIENDYFNPAGKSLIDSIKYSGDNNLYSILIYIITRSVTRTSFPYILIQQSDKVINNPDILRNIYEKDLDEKAVEYLEDPIRVFSDVVTGNRLIDPFEIVRKN